MTASDRYSPEQKLAVLKFVRQTMEAVLNRETGPASAELGDAFTQEGSCFVTLHTASGNLRGCIGNIEAFEPLAANLEHNAVNSAFRDPRFPPVGSKEELAQLVIEVSILTPPEDIDTIEEFIVGQHGIILRIAGRSAVFLPQVAPEQGWDRETTMAHLSMKAGLSPQSWQEEGAQYQVFEAIVFGENETA